MATFRTVTLNTGYDDYYQVSGISWGGVESVHSFRSICSGKGIGCARTAVALAVPTQAYALVGEEDQADFSQRLTREGIAHHLAGVPGSTRHNLTLLDHSGQRVAAHCVAPGFTLRDPKPAQELISRVIDEVIAGDVVSFNGSVPVGLSDDIWARAAQACLARGAFVIVDAQHAALQAALAISGMLAFTPNQDEIAALLTPTPRSPSALIAASLDVVAAAKPALPLVTLGQDGVVFREVDQTVYATCPVESPVQSVGAGDAFVAGLAWGVLNQATGRQLVAHALAAASAHVAGLSGALLQECAQRSVNQVVFHETPLR